MTDTNEIGMLISAVEKRSLDYLQEEMNLTVDKVIYSPQSVKSLTLRDLTALVSVGGNLGVYIAFSFDAQVIRDIFEYYTADLDIDPDEEEMYIDETAGDVINTVIGNALAEMPDGGAAISLTPPVVLSQAKSLIRYKDAFFYMTDMTTAKGVISIMYIGPKKVFDDNLDYTGQ